MSRGVRVLVVAIVIALLSGVFASWVSAQTGAPIAKPPIEPRSTGSSLKTHVVEVLTGLWCPPCGGADPGLGRIADEWAKDLIVIMYHCCSTSPSSGNYDPYYDPAVLAPRDAFYGFQYLPTMVVDGGGDYLDGTLFNVGSAGPEGTYDELQADIVSRTDPTTNMYLEVSGDLTPTTAEVEVRVTATDAVPQTGLRVRTVLYEEPLYGVQANGPDFHRYVARGISESSVLAITNGQTVTTTASFTLNSLWNYNKLGVAAFVQSDVKTTINQGGSTYTISDILNAARYDFAPKGILVYRDAGTTTDYTEPYEVLISTRNDYSFDNWNAYVNPGDSGTVDNRGTPTAADLAEYPLVIWRTGAEGTNVLSTTERTLIGDHLASTGSLFLTGDDIGFDAWTNYRSWYQTNLHVNFAGDNSGFTTMTGVTGDAIGDPYSGLSLNIIGDPDRITPMVQTGTAAPFQYATNVYGSVRSQHDADSRVVYLGFQYFEGTDFYQSGVMGSIIGWIDGASGPVVDVQYPDGGEQLAQGAAVTIRWYANDVVMPGDAIDLYFSDNGGTSWQLIAAGEPNDGRYAWTVPNVDSAECRIRVIARDMSSESGDGVAMSDSNFICGEPGFVLTFTSADLGWQLVSFPTILSDTSVATVLSSMSGNYRVVRAFNPASARPWMSYDPSRTAGALQYIDNTMAFWIEVTAPGSLILQGQKPTGTQFVSLRAGWNLVGFPSYRTDYTVAQLKLDTDARRVEGFDPSNIEYRLRVLGDTELLATGQGYWVYVETNTLWQVPT